MYFKCYFTKALDSLSEDGSCAIHSPEPEILAGEMMLIAKSFKDGTALNILVTKKTEIRLSETCFRGMEKKLAGNFSRWDSMSYMLGEKIVIDEFLAHVEELKAHHELETSSFTIDCEKPIGWASTAPLGQFQPEDLEAFKLNHKSKALRVKLDRSDLLAPVTSKVTFVCEFQHSKNRNDTFVILIHSVYPGEDIGELRGDVSKREQCAFFSWGHPGAAS